MSITYTLNQLRAMPERQRRQLIEATRGDILLIEEKGNSSRVLKSRNGGQWTEARYWQAVRSALRRAFRFWGPALAALKQAREPYFGPHSQKWAYRCADCRRLFKRRGVEIDHVEPCGALTDLAHLPDFLRRLTPEDPAAYRIRCLRCHRAKTAADKAAA